MSTTPMQRGDHTEKPLAADGLVLATPAGPAVSIASEAPVGAAAVLAARWPDVTRVPGAGVRALIARQLFRQAVKRLPVRVLLPQQDTVGRPSRRTGRNDRGEARKQVWGAGGPGDPTMHLLRPDDFFARLGAGGLIGFGESYLARDWVAGPPANAPESASGQPDPLVALLTVLAAELPRLVPPALQRLRRLAVRYQPKSEENTPGGSRSNISRHYDLSNDLFATFLDPTLTYSAAIFGPENGEPVTDGEDRAEWRDLPSAQARKIDRLLDGCGVTAGTRLLEIGTGWGELALRAAARGARVHSITLSEEQLALAERRVAEAGFADRVTIELCDYRAVTGQYDAVISVEMIEAVGEAYWPAYFETIDRVLAPGGSVGLQAITMPHNRMVASRRTYTWIHKYVFPGGLLPSVRAVHAAVEGTSMRVVDDLAFGLGYAQTLRLWRERFVEHEAEVRRLGFDPIFRRMWTFYLAYSEAGFRSRYLDVHQFILRRPLENSL
jgi:cyclopropane-fatty-acyl-phospholipid synthase